MENQYSIEDYKQLNKQRLAKAQASKEAFTRFKVETEMDIKAINAIIKDNKLGFELLSEDASLLNEEKLQAIYQEVKAYKQELEHKIRIGLGLEQPTTQEQVQQFSQTIQDESNVFEIEKPESTNQQSQQLFRTGINGKNVL